MNNQELAATFPNTVNGLAVAWEWTVSLRRAGFKTRLAERTFQDRFAVVTVVATPPVRPNRTERCRAMQEAERKGVMTL
jgi:hypothetical protein